MSETGRQEELHGSRGKRRDGERRERGSSGQRPRPECVSVPGWSTCAAIVLLQVSPLGQQQHLV